MTTQADRNLEVQKVIENLYLEIIPICTWSISKYPNLAQRLKSIQEETWQLFRESLSLQESNES